MRSLLCVPGSKLAMLQKAFGTSADQIIIDLEDSVTTLDKPLARENVEEFFRSLKTDKRVSIRLNERSSDEIKADRNLIRALRGGPLTSVILPKIHTLDDVRFWNRYLPREFSFEVQIESAMGLVNTAAIASHSRVHSLAFGPADFMASTGMPSSAPGTPSNEVPRALEYPLSEIVIAAHAYGKLAYDGPYFEIANQVGLSDSANTARALGADGKWAIHPDQISIINELFTPSEEEIETAQRIIDAFDNSSGAANFNGLMIDEASKKVAERLLERATRIHK